MIKNIVILLGLVCFAQSQDDLLDFIESEPKPPVPVGATFKATRIVNAQSIELARPKTLEFVIQHRFGSMKHGLYDLMGMDESTIRFDLNYGLNKYMSVGLGRSSFKKTYDIFSKIKLINQTSVFPFSVALFLKSEIETLERNSDFSHQIENRVTYDSQLLIAKKFNSKISLQLMPTWIHHNWVKTHQDKHDLFSMGIGARLKLSKRISINADSFFPIEDRDESYVQPWGFGCDIETGGHVFQLMVTNVQGTFESVYIEKATGKLDGMHLFLGFNISRAFTF